MITTNMKPYIDRCGEQVFVPPFVARISNFYGFAVQADHEKLNKNICDRFFNDPLDAKGRFTALKYVIFVFATIDQACSADEKYKDRGVFAYNEAAIWMLIADHVDKEIRWFQPYVFVDDPYAMLAGREIYGFPKTLGSFQIPEGPEPPESIWVKTTVVKKAGDAGEAALLFEAGHDLGSQCPHSRCDEKSDFFGKILATLQVTGPEYFLQFGFGKEFATNAYKDLLQMKLPLLFIKQFRDGVDPMQANAAIVQEAASQITKFYGSHLYHGAYEIAINDVCSHPIRRDLGLPEGNLKVDLAFWMSLNFSLGPCKLIKTSS
jgi:hypothetical protein